MNNEQFVYDSTKQQKTDSVINPSGQVPTDSSCVIDAYHDTDCTEADDNSKRTEPLSQDLKYGTDTVMENESATTNQIFEEQKMENKETESLIIVETVVTNGKDEWEQPKKRTRSTYTESNVITYEN